MASATKSAEKDDEGAKAPAAKAKGGRSPMLLVLAAAMIAAAMASGATWFLTGRHAPAKEGSGEAAAAEGEADKPKAEQPALYLEMTPAFVVNMADEDSMRFLQVEVQLMARDPKVVDAAKNNMPRIRNALMLLFGQQHSRDIGSRTAKEALQKQALDEVNKALKAENVQGTVDAIYFTSFVMQ
jgi:flagellar FliL protein